MDDQVGESGLPGIVSGRPVTGPPVGSDAWLEAERRRLRGTDAPGEHRRGRIQIVLAMVLLAGGAWVDWYLLSHMNNSGFSLTPEGVFTLCIFPIVLGGVVLIDGLRRIREHPRN